MKHSESTAPLTMRCRRSKQTMLTMCIRKMYYGVVQKKRSVNKDSVSDADKIRLQLYLDVRAYRNQLEALSRDVGSELARTTERLESLVKLPDRVSRFVSA